MEATLDARAADVTLHETVLSGDLGVADDASDNAYTVVYCAETVVTTVDGVSIVEGNADGTFISDYPGRDRGGAVYSAGELTLVNSRLMRNDAIEDGGAVHCSAGTLTVSHSLFEGNRITGCCADGGGVYVATSCTATITNSTFLRNSINGSSGSGGGIFISPTSEVVITNSTFAANSTMGSTGGGIFNRGTLALTNSTIAGNSARQYGGGICCRSADSVTILNNTLVAQNAASSAPDAYHDDAAFSGSHNLIGNGSGQSGLVDGENGNLVGTASSPIEAFLGEWSQLENGLGGFHLLSGSPAIDAGDSALAVYTDGSPISEDLQGSPRIAGSTVDIGAFEGVASGTPGRSYLVTSLEPTVAEDGVLTFFEAFEAANQNRSVGDAVAGSFTDQDTIRFAEGVTGTVILDEGELGILGDLYIDGPGDGLVSFDAGGRHRVLRVHPNIALSLDGVTVTGGASSDGSGIYVDRGTLTAANTAISGNTAPADEILIYTHGGGVYNRCGTVVLTDCEVTENSAACGGGIANFYGTATVTGTVFDRNLASQTRSSAKARGGGIYNVVGTVTVTNSTLTDNRAKNAYLREAEGGGIWNSYEATLAVAGSTFSGNSSHSGGGICNDSGSLTISASAFSGNSATVGVGGGIWCAAGPVTIAESTFEANSATESGGGIHIDADSTLAITDSSLQANSALTAGGAIYSAGTLTFTNSSAGLNTAGGSEMNGNGGGIYIRSAAATLTNSSLWRNAARNGGGIYGNAATIALANCVLVGNVAGSSGGGIQTGGGELAVMNSTISGNTAASGGGISGGGATLVNSIVALNGTEDVALGGPLSAESGCNLIGIDPEFIRNPGTNGEDDLGDLRPAPLSLAIDAGDIGGIPADAYDLDEDGNTTEPLPFDLGGEARVFGGSVDIGAYESRVTPVGDRETRSLIVTTNDDVFDTFDGQISLREAVYYASDASLGGTITFAPELSGAAIVLAEGEIIIDRPLTVNASSLPGGLTLDGGGSNRIFRALVGEEEPVGLVGLTFTNGRTERGGAVFNSGNLTIMNCRFFANKAIDTNGGAGGAIFNTGKTAVDNCVFVGNAAIGISRYGIGGAICSTGPLAVTNSTLSGNFATEHGGGISGASGTALYNTIVAGNAAGNGAPDFSSVSTWSRLFASHSLIGDGSNLDDLGEPYYNNLVGTSETPLDPRFLRNPSDGGDGWGDDSTTPGIDESANDDYGDLRLATDSPAVNGGDNTRLPADVFDLDGDGDVAERIPFDLGGGPRVQAGVVDMGAYETTIFVGGPVLYVDADAGPGGDGRSWNTAFNDLDDALETASFFNGGDAPVIEEIWIAEGTYRPSRLLEDSDVRSASFVLPTDAVLCGGFEGSEMTRDARDWESHPTILSGDIGTPGDASDNAYTVCYCAQDVNATLDGISIVGGNADGEVEPFYLPSERHYGGGVYSAGTLTLVNSTIRDNWAERGGGVYYDRGAVNLVNTTISRNTTLYDGGGVFGHSGTLTATGSLFVRNEARSGGAVFFESDTATIVNCTVAANSAQRIGGLYYHLYGTLELTNSIVAGNVGGELGGYGEYSAQSANNLLGIDPQFVRMPGTDGPDDSGDLRLVAESPAIDLGDSAALPVDALDLDGDGDTSEPIPVDSGGAGRVFGESVDAGAYEYQAAPPTGRETPAIAVTTLDDGFDLYDGETTLREALFYAGSEALGATVTFASELSGGTLVVNGSGLHIADPLTVDASSLPDGLTVDGDDQSSVFTVVTEEGVELRGLTVTNGHAMDGGGIDNYGILTLTECTVRENVADDRGGGVHSLGTLSVVDCEISGNSARYGGGTYADGMLAMTDSTVVENAGGAGGGIYSTSGELTILDSTVSYNSGGEGAGVYARRGAASITNSTLSDNNASGRGGAIRGDECEPITIVNGTLTGNTASSGGAIYDRQSTIRVVSSTLSQNAATHTGGAAFFDSSQALTLVNSVVAGNAAGWGGGAGLACQIRGPARIVNTSIVANATEDGYGGGIFNNSSEPLTVTNSTIAANTARFGGGVYIANTVSLTTLNNSIVAYNAATAQGPVSYGPDVYAYDGTLSGSHTLISDGSHQTDLIDGENGNLVGTPESPIDPLFIRNPSDGGDGWGDDPDTPDVDESLNDDYGDLRLRADSPAVDAGSNELLPADEFDLDGDGDTSQPLPFDFDGNPRIQNGTVDMGAYEYVAPVLVPGDLNGDEMVGGADLDIVRANWGRSVAAGSLLEGDPSGDGLVGGADLDIVRANWGRTAPPAAGVDVVWGELADAPEDVPRGEPVYGPRRRDEARAETVTASAREQWDIWTAALEAWEREWKGRRGKG